MSTLKSKYKSHYILFMEAGFIAVNQMDEASALHLFRAAQLINPEAPLTEVGFGYLHLCKLQLKKAIEHFESVLKKDPSNEMAKALLSMTKVFSTSKEQVTEAHEILDSLTHSKDKHIQDFSKSSLDFMEKFMKKSAKA